MSNIDLKDVVLNACDHSVEDWKNDVLDYLGKYNKEFDTHAMSDYKLYKEGQLNMLRNVIAFIKNT